MNDIQKAAIEIIHSRPYWRYNLHENKVQDDDELGLLGRVPDGSRGHANRSRRDECEGRRGGNQWSAGEPGGQSRLLVDAPEHRYSQRYDAVVHSNSHYRASRVKKECGPINDPELHASCVASFE